MALPEPDAAGRSGLRCRPANPFSCQEDVQWIRCNGFETPVHLQGKRRRNRRPHRPTHGLSSNPSTASSLTVVGGRSRARGWRHPDSVTLSASRAPPHRPRARSRIVKGQIELTYHRVAEDASDDVDARQRRCQRLHRLDTTRAHRQAGACVANRSTSPTGSGEPAIVVTAATRPSRAPPRRPSARSSSWRPRCSSGTTPDRSSRRQPMIRTSSRKSGDCLFMAPRWADNRRRRPPACFTRQERLTRRS